ncbi:TetR family transcriptional regulator [Tamaricihabitans halophyticus]|uniref:TetR family transcriptional regulator n=1 Tax=Tamaricihabitans halophyticus TaxID=1262583 RepID=A0A4R2R4D8_9PSEU|nr:TetR/AcrR family transcriptional regulator [Tamaricihabitans halophyticus]TCP54235.1 TetR family transcriptional regulator [Tamaricihabitans halophyticus]
MDLATIQQASVRAFADRGFAATGIRDIARNAGVTSGALYHYATSKEELLIAVMRISLTELSRLAAEAVTDQPEPASQLAQLVRTHVALQATSPQTALVVDREVRALSEDNQRAAMSLRDDYEAHWRTVLDAGIAECVFDVPDPRVARLALLEMCNGVANWYRPDGALGLAELQEVFVRLAFGLAGCQRSSAASIGSYVEMKPLSCEPISRTTTG